MTDQRSQAALARIDAALTRIERAPLHVPTSAPPAADRSHAELAARHEAMRAETRKAIEELDAVLRGLQ